LIAKKGGTHWNINLASLVFVGGSMFQQMTRFSIPQVDSTIAVGEVVDCLCVLRPFFLLALAEQTTKNMQPTNERQGNHSTFSHVFFENMVESMRRFLLRDQVKEKCVFENIDGTS